MKIIHARRFPPASRVFLTLILLLPAVPAAAQSEVFTGDVEVRVVNVDVVVTAADGTPVTGLTQEDFELRVDGTPVAIRYFAAAEAPPEPPPTEPPAGTENRLNLVVLLDRAYLRPGYAVDLQPALQELVDRDLRPTDRVMLARADRRVQVVGELRRPPVDVAPLFAQSARLGRGERLRAEYYVGGRMPITPGTSLVDAWRSAYSAVTDASLAKEMQAAATQAEGFENQDRPLETRNFYNVPVLKVPERTPELFTALAREASARGVAFYTLDANSQRSTAWRSMRGSQSALSLRASERWEFHASQRQGNKEVMTALAEATGGRAMVSQRDVGEVRDALRLSRTASYSLGFLSAPAAERSEEMHTVEVRLRPAPGRKRKKLRLRHRRHFYDRLPDTEVADRTISAVLLAENAFGSVFPPWSPRGDNPLAVELDVGEPAAATGDEPRRLPITVKVPVAKLGLVAEGRVHRGQLSLFWTSGSFSGGAAPVMKVVVPVPIRNDELLAVFGRYVEYQFAIELPANARAIAVSVRDDLASELATMTHLLE